jgi:hypothetical protein
MVCHALLCQRIASAKVLIGLLHTREIRNGIDKNLISDPDVLIIREELQCCRCQIAARTITANRQAARVNADAATMPDDPLCNSDSIFKAGWKRMFRRQSIVDGRHNDICISADRTADRLDHIAVADNEPATMTINKSRQRRLRIDANTLINRDCVLQYFWAACS